MTLYATMNEEQLRAQLAQRDEEVGHMTHSRDHWRDQAHELEGERDDFRSLVVGFAESVEKMIGPISVDESIEVHAIRMQASDIKGELS